jgi:hypothetical protein
MPGKRVSHMSIGAMSGVGASEHGASGSLRKRFGGFFNNLRDARASAASGTSADTPMAPPTLEDSPDTNGQIRCAALDGSCACVIRTHESCTRF